MTIETIQGHDPAFDQTAFLSRAEAVLALVLRARAEGRLAQARAVLSEDMAVRIGAEVDGLRTAGRRQVHQGIKVRSSEVVQAGSDGTWDTIAVRFSIEGVAYEAGADDKPVSGANRDKRRWSEVWWFQRHADATTSAGSDVPLDLCPGCGAPVTPTADGACTYCQRKLASPRAWVLSRVTSSDPTPEEIFSTFALDASAVTGAARTAGRIVSLVVLLVVIGVIASVVIFASRTTKSVTEAFNSTRPGTATVVTMPPGFPFPPGVSIPGSASTPSTQPGFLTPVANPKVMAPVNDVAAAAAAVLAKVGRPLVTSSIHLYPDGRIIFEVQAADDPKGIDNWTWKGGTVSGPEQAIIGADPSRFYPVAGLDLSNLARLCDAALGASGIADGIIESPYLLKLPNGLRWYIPVQSLSRGSTRKTYQVGADGSKPIVF
ncbi:MAG: TIM44-like domain-containing protein [Acidimicrobiales bacterium]